MKKTCLVIILVFVSKFCFSQNGIITMSDQNTLSNNPIVIYKQFAMLFEPDFKEQKPKTRILKIAFGMPVFLNPEQNSPWDRKENCSLPDSLKFIVSGKSYTYNGQIIKESEMYKMMLSKNDPDLNKTIKKARITRRIQYIGFGGIYLGAACIGAFVLSSIFPKKNIDFTDPDFYLADFYGAAALALGTTGIVFHIRHKKLKARAVSFYNEKY